MAKIEINDLASLGVIRDVEGYMLPPEAWTLGENVRFRDGGVEKLAGRAQVFGTPGVAPHFALPISNSSQTFWLYTSLTKGYVYDGSSHTNITRQTAGVDVDYTAAGTRDWNGVLFGGVPILNNGADVPQYWSSLSTATKLAALPNWPAAKRAKVVRSLGAHLIALNITDGANVYPHMVLWSHPADPGSVPSSWDVTDPTVDAGQTDLADVTAGLIVDGLPLRDNLMIYKEGSTWRMRHVGGTFIFNFDQFLTTSGILAPRCVALTGDGTRHVVATQDDIIVHNGNSVESILNQRFKRYLFNQIDIDHFANSFMFCNPFNYEVWFCFPESGAEFPTRALIWNYKEGQKGAISEANITAFRNVGVGTIESATTDTWATVSGSWASYIGPWSQTNRRKVVLCATEATKFLEMDSGTLNNGSAFTATVQREGLALVGRKRSGEWIVDFSQRKFVRRIWIKLDGGPVNVRVGFQAAPDAAVSWSAAQSFDPSTQNYIDVVGSGLAVAIEISSTADVSWRLLGYKIDGELAGEF